VISDYDLMMTDTVYIYADTLTWNSIQS